MAYLCCTSESQSHTGTTGTPCPSYTYKRPMDIAVFLSPLKLGTWLVFVIISPLHLRYHCFRQFPLFHLTSIKSSRPRINHSPDHHPQIIRPHKTYHDQTACRSSPLTRYTYHVFVRRLFHKFT
ncbi:hypothetical protein BDR03DRAFT_955126 [Suillus americanus]|nr:hypothetical protein BDR03DRAFT_955126 [Suillus americanus]